MHDDDLAYVCVRTTFVDFFLNYIYWSFSPLIWNSDLTKIAFVVNKDSQKTFQLQAALSPDYRLSDHAEAVPLKLATAPPQPLPRSTSRTHF